MSGGISPTPVPEPATILGSLVFGAFAARAKYKRQSQQNFLNSKVS